METLIEGVTGIATEPGRLVMMIIGGILMYLGIKKEYEPTLLVPMGLGTILVNFPIQGYLVRAEKRGRFKFYLKWGSAQNYFLYFYLLGLAR